MGESQTFSVRENPHVVLSEIKPWLEAFAYAVRERDVDRGHAMFSPDVIGFGTVTPRAENLDDLVADQWNAVWPNTENFDFDYDQLTGSIAGDTAWVAAPWSSVGFDTSGRPFDRHGRATIVLQRSADRWLAIHTHFSLRPTQDSQS